MKIGLVCPYNMFRGGGVQECVTALQRHLEERGHDVYVISPQPSEGESRKLHKTILLGGARDFKSPFHTTAQVSFSANTDELAEALAAHNFDVLHFHEPWVPMLSRQLLAKSNSVNVATFHAKLPDTVMSRTIERVITPYTKSVIKYLDCLTAVSTAAAEYVSDLTKQEVMIIPNGIELVHFTRKTTTKKKPNEPATILFIGRLEKRKGVKYLLQAYKQLSEATALPVRLIIAGDGPDRQKLEAYAQQLELNNVEFLGFIDEATKLDLLHTADVFCSPALYGESFGIVLLEAMAAGLPIVAGDNPGYATVMTGTGAVSLVNPRYCDEFARRLHLLLFDQAIRDTWTTWALEHINQFDYTRVVDHYEALYHDVRASA